MAETKPKTKIKKVAKETRYIEALGGRKNARARVRITEDKSQGSKEFIVNGKSVDSYFSSEHTRIIARDALSKAKAANRFAVSARVSGGGEHAQAEALRHGSALALIKFNEEWRKKLKRAGFLKRDPRQVERKKFGKKKARKSPQWSKR